MAAQETHRPAADRVAEKRQAAGGDGSLWLGKVGAWFVVIAVGGLFFAVNGGYSVIGLDYVSRQLNTAGAIFWSLISTWRFALPVTVPGVDTSQPVIPWLLVLGSSLLQVAAVWRKLSGRRVPAWMVALTIVTSLYDFGSTFFGFGTVTWVRRAGWLLQVPLTLLFTFGLEMIIGFLLRRK